MSFHAHQRQCVHASLFDTCVYLCVYKHLSAWAPLICALRIQSNPQLPLKTSQAPTETQKKVQNTCFDVGDGRLPTEHMGPIPALMKTTQHKYQAKRTRAAPLQCGWHGREHLIILRVLRKDWKRGEKAGRCNRIHLMHNNMASQKHKHPSLLWSRQVTEHAIPQSGDEMIPLL